MPELNLLHMLTPLCAAGCFYFARWEVPRRTIRPKRLFWAPLFGGAAAVLLMFFQIGTRQPLWPFLVALLLGLSAGVARGLTMQLEVDEYWLVVRPMGRRVLLWVGSLLVLAVAIDIAGAVVGPDGREVRYGAALAAMACAAALFGRALAIAGRVRRLGT